MRRPSIGKGPASHYADANERIVEFSANDGTGTGGLLSIRRLDDGRLVVSVYRTDGPVEVSGPHASGRGR